MYINRTARLCQECRDTATCNPQTPSKRCSNDGTTVCCGRDTYFIDGISTQCIPCDEGSYLTNGSGSECILCPPGFNCSSGPPHTCLSNFWADNGKCTPCTPACNPGYLVKNASSGNNVFISYLDTTGVTSASYTAVYSTPRALFVRVRFAGTGGSSYTDSIKTFESPASFPGSSAAIRTPDA